MLGGMMVHPEHLSCRAGTGTAGDGLACLGMADSFAGVAGAVVAAPDKGVDSLSDTAGVMGVMVSGGAGAVGVHSTAVLGAGNSCGSGSLSAGCAAMWCSLR